MKLILPRLLLTSDPAEGGATPPAAATVLNSDVKEADAAEIVRLKRDLEDRESTLKLRETRLSELEDENRTLKTPVPVPVKQEAPEKKGFLSGATFFS